MIEFLKMIKSLVVVRLFQKGIQQYLQKILLVKGKDVLSAADSLQEAQRMKTCNCLSFLIWTCMIHEIPTLLSPKRTSMYLQAERIMGLSKDQGKAMHRTKRGWMWNQFFLLEEYTGPDTQYVGKLHTDQDKGDGNLKYILTGDGAGSLFVIDENTGDIHAAKRLDREEKSLYVLRAKAIDRNTGRQVEPESEFIIKIHDINDNEPKFTKDIYIANVPEKSGVGTSVIQVTATDADDANYGNSAKIVYSILQGQPYFSVDPETGIIKTALPDMSRENREQYQVVIQAKDMGGQMGGLSGTTMVNITLTDVNDNPPRFPQSTYQFSSLESAPLGTSLGRIKANDPDVGENAAIEYSIAAGDGSDMFDIITDKDTQEGILTVKKQLDFEKKNLYNLKVEATNTHPDPRFFYLGPFKDSALVKVYVEDVDEPPVFNIPSNLIEVDEDVREGSIIGQVIAQDPDATRNLIKYSLDRHTDLDRIFNIYSGNGSIFVSKNLDREAAPWHNLTVIATEISNPKQSTQTPIFIRILDINDHAPEFAKFYETFVCENAKAGQLIQTVSAVDKDEPPRGHKFFFELVPEYTVHPNFSIVDNKVLVVLFAAMKRQRKKEPLIISKDDVRDNIVTYNDEGGGEEDTQAFDIGTLRNPEAREESKMRRDVMPETIFQIRRTASLWENIDIQDFIHRRLKENDLDPTAPPYDSLATYAYEGNDSIANSLSSLESLTTDGGNQDYDYLSDWGPRFKKLADMYGGDESDQD
ncbi:cadherin-9 isoform 3-T3 [Liasis olivaceus]